MLGPPCVLSQLPLYDIVLMCACKVCFTLAQPLLRAAKSTTIKYFLIELGVASNAARITTSWSPPLNHQIDKLNLSFKCSLSISVSSVWVRLRISSSDFITPDKSVQDPNLILPSIAI